MHGFVIRGIESFLRARHGDAVWQTVCAASGLDRRGAQMMRSYQPDIALRMIQSASVTLRMDRDELLEDIGGWIPRFDSIRHVMRFSGSSFDDFVLSLDDLHDRGRVVLPGLHLPRIDTRVVGPKSYHLSLTTEEADWYPVLAGFLRGMADDYGVLAIVEREAGWLDVRIADDAFAEASHFSLNEIAGAAR
ncbi:heme NO-binding domain-containing protein [Paracoccus sediminicola]|uniref:heme NO-binding domain-containing protein n=1 Tax=Paracoccus sediminicola TaxID=3017783 RepID=UPI0022EFFD84|nr:heme NO-binding domain-containing protein [Paracoccus sediminicola]WBU57519.1 heme NO-binding domain-containing protein [Paracoccus sediminicola]